MHDIEPFYGWRDQYIASEDKESIFHGSVSSEFQYSNTVYNYYVHPQWDEMGSPNLYIKVLFVDYEKGVAIIELIGEWNDCLANDIMLLKRNIIDGMIDKHINKFVLVCENVLSFHCDDNSYYEEWAEEVREYEGWIVILGTLQHVEEEMLDNQIDHYIQFGSVYNSIPWRTYKPQFIAGIINDIIANKHHFELM